MKIDVIVSPEHITNEKLKGKIAVVIDMLRATTVMTTAFINGCEEVIPFLTVEEVFEKAEKLGRENCVLGGEREAKKIEGFDFANSPLEYTSDIVKGKTLLMTTTNGTRTLTSCLAADRILVASMLNAKAIAETLVEIGQDVVIVNAGTNGAFTMDDFICGGYIIWNMCKMTNKLELTDVSKTARYIYEHNDGIEEFISEAKHYKVMKSLGLMEDVKHAMQKSITTIVPEYKDGHIIKIK